MQYTAPILGKVFSHVSLVLVWSSSRKTCLPNLSRQQNQIKKTTLFITLASYRVAQSICNQSLPLKQSMQVGISVPAFYLSKIYHTIFIVSIQNTVVSVFKLINFFRNVKLLNSQDSLNLQPNLLIFLFLLHLLIHNSGYYKYMGISTVNQRLYYNNHLFY